MSSAKKVTVVSGATPQEGQRHRSSNNFTTADFKENCGLYIRAFYDYGTGGQREAKDVTFAINCDKTGHDTTYAKNVKSGDCYKNTDNRNLYIADPDGAQKEFTVVIESGAVRSEQKTMDGQNHRSSNNFPLTGFEAGSAIKFNVYYDYEDENETRATELSFYLKQDKSGKDSLIYREKIMDGMELGVKSVEKAYIADPDNATDSFTVVIEQV